MRQTHRKKEHKTERKLISEKFKGKNSELCLLCVRPGNRSVIVYCELEQSVTHE